MKTKTRYRQKRLFYPLIRLNLVLAIILTFLSCATSPQKRGFIMDNSGTVLCYAGPEITTLVIPPHAKGRAISAIGDKAFFMRTGIITLDFSHCRTLTSIGDEAFFGCESISNLDFSNCPALVVIGTQAFANCYGIANLKLSGCRSLASIKESAFVDCKSLAVIDFSGCTALTDINESAFAGCENIIRINFSECTGLTSIEKAAFANCLNLTNADLSACTMLNSIGTWAFSGCPRTVVTLPASISEIAEDAFGTVDSIADYRCKEVIVPNESVKKLVTDSGYTGKITVQNR
ncbi:leucine-rich repeat domain-containing protein [Treponema phagedenis]|uniref:Leucine Rich Repeat protein n=1 Tax=Treponema phagedenis TaxID=162 RepID=A0A0B7GZ32_TREPH|nr:leucine-rich repeat domain-containing protein [Treponema phagedenis]QSH99233.1 leucine-rich repeat domain-containing protein [Treponema phagedenis]CEM61921.1 Leucine Rich Repeat protein [Treponema phagedenis]